MSRQTKGLAPMQVAMSMPETDTATLVGLPDGVVDLAKELLAGHQLPTDADVTSDSAGVTDEQLAALLYAPKQLDRGWPRPVEPIQVGDGWVHAELIDEDRPLFEALVEQHGQAGPEAVAARCQEVRLPVCPYRAPQALPVVAPLPETGNRAGGRHQSNLTAIADALVVDLTTHWAGPLATKLLADAGATVIKVDPSCRPDGFGDRPFVYQHLNGNKEIVDLDLRSPGGRQQFEALLAGADLVVESFSRRVMTNLGYQPAELRSFNPALSTVSIKAFPAERPEADWLAYGPGVHAAEGLAALGPPMPGGLPPQPMPAPIAYPDFVTGIAAYVASAELLSAPERTTGRHPASGDDVEVAMATVIAPLRATATPWPTGSGTLTDVGTDE